MSAAQEGPLSWTWGYTVADMDVIAKLDDDTRATVERYVRDRAFGVTFEGAAKAGERTEAEENAYAEGFSDGVDEAASNASSTYYYPRKKKVRL